DDLDVLHADPDFHGHARARHAFSGAPGDVPARPDTAVCDGILCVLARKPDGFQPRRAEEADRLRTARAVPVGDGGADALVRADRAEVPQADAARSELVGVGVRREPGVASRDRAKLHAFALTLLATPCSLLDDHAAYPVHDRQACRTRTAADPC